MVAPTNWVKIEPRLHMPRSRVAVLDFIRRLSRIDSGDEERIDDALDEFLLGASKWATKDRQRLWTLAHVLSDIARQGWGLCDRGKDLRDQPPSEIETDPIDEKLRV